MGRKNGHKQMNKKNKVNEIIFGFFYGTHRVDKSPASQESQMIQAIIIRKETRESHPDIKR